MKTAFKVILSIVFFSFLMSCASTTVLPEGEGKYSLVTTSSSEGYALKAAKSKAVEHCSKLNKELVVLNYKATYQGMDKNTQALANIAGALLTGSPNAGTSSDDYKVEMKFRCK
tara:strand:- start:1418 stop:1759 length:342 start_codon:yes stop_codon:yes gene_type:complete